MTLKGLAGFPQVANDYRRGAQSRGGTVYACALRSRRYSRATEAFNVNENGYNDDMPALDQFHQAVRNALVKDGWTITADPLTLRVGADRIHIDLAAERVLIAEKGTRKIAVEIKTFAGASKIADLENALGQYVLYRMALRRTEPERELYLAVPQSVVINQFQSRELWQAFFTDENGKMFGYDVETEEIVQWLPQND